MSKPTSNVLNDCVKDILIQVINDNKRLSARSDLLISHVTELIDKVEILEKKNIKHVNNIELLERKYQLIIDDRRMDKLHLNACGNEMFITSNWYSNPIEYFYWKPYVDFSNTRVLAEVNRWSSGFASFMGEFLKQSGNLQQLPPFLQDIINTLGNNINWKPNDILVINNLLVSHGRRKYSGDRKVYVLMTNDN